MANLTLGESFLKFIDSNDNQKLDEGELAYLEVDGNKQYFRSLGQRNDFYFLDAYLESIDGRDLKEGERDYQGPSYVFSPKYGFLAKNTDSANRPFVMATGPKSLDAIGFEILTGSQIRISLDTFNSLPQAADLKIAFDDDQTSLHKFYEALDDQLLLNQMGYASLDDLRSQVNIYTEGELATESPNRIYKEAPMFLTNDTVMGVSWQEGLDDGKPIIALNDTFLKRAYHPSHDHETQAKWNNAVRSVIYHEGHHVKDSFNSADVLKPSSTYGEGIHKLVGEVLDQTSRGREMSFEIAKLHRNNDLYYNTYKTYFPFINDPYKTNRAVFLNAFQEAKAYVDQFSYISKVGLKNFPPVFLEHIREGAHAYFDVCAAMLSLPGGEVCIQALFEPLASVDQDVKDFFFSDWNRYSDYYGERLKTLKPYL